MDGRANPLIDRKVVVIPGCSAAERSAIKSQLQLYGCSCSWKCPVGVVQLKLYLQLQPGCRVVKVVVAVAVAVVSVAVFVVVAVVVVYIVEVQLQFKLQCICSCLFTCRCICVACPLLFLSLCLSIQPSFCLAICLPASLKTKLFSETSSISEGDDTKKRRNSAMRPQLLKLIMSKTKSVCQTSSALQAGDIKNEASL